jgi:DNA-binding HxlR family transcriptional regulator
VSSALRDRGEIRARAAELVNVVDVMDNKLKYLDKIVKLAVQCGVRSYHQFCALARALDVIGERWTLLIIRELFARECRYSDLREALPGIATNLLAQRLRDLQAHGVIEAHDAPAPVRATVYRLTTRGRGLAPVLASLVSWGAPLLNSQAGDEFRMHWMALGLPALLQDVDLDDLAPLQVVIRSGGEVATLSVGRDGAAMEVGVTAPAGAVTVEGAPDQIVAFLLGEPAPGQAAVDIRGTREDVRRLRTMATRVHQARHRRMA